MRKEEEKPERDILKLTIFLIVSFSTCSSKPQISILILHKAQKYGDSLQLRRWDIGITCIWEKKKTVIKSSFFFFQIHQPDRKVVFFVLPSLDH